MAKRGAWQLQRALGGADAGHAVKVAVFDLVAQVRHDRILAREKVGTGEVGAAHGVVRDEDAVAGEILHEQQQLAAFMFACMPPVLRDAYRVGGTGSAVTR